MPDLKSGRDSSATDQKKRGGTLPTIPGYDPLTIDSGFTSPATKQKIYGLALNADYQSWLVRTEAIYINRPGATWKDLAQIVGVGYRIDKWLPMLTWSNYYSLAANGSDPTALEAHATTSLTLRYDLTTSSDLKVQYDSQKDKSGPNWGVAGGPAYGDARLLTFTYDMVF